MQGLGEKKKNKKFLGSVINNTHLKKASKKACQCEGQGSENWDGIVF